jgi:peptide/nickel transport system substrate-binding protein
MSSKLHISRREFLKTSTIAAAGALVAACAKSPTAAPAEPTATTAAAAPTATTAAAAPTATTAPPPEAGAGKEAPMLADQVSSGALPPLDERLPADPMLLEPVDTIGQYGGTLVFMNQGETMGTLQLIAFDENHLKFSREGTTALRANLVSSYEWNDDASEIVLNFRKGIKWSDGEPLTANDWVWWWENLILDENVGIPAPTGTAVGGENMTLEKIDDYTLKCTFSGPNPLFLPQINRGGGTRGTCYQMVPAHYYEQLHYKFNNTLSSTDVQELRDQFNNRYQYPGIPHCGPFAVTEFTAGEKAVLDRNAYYWKVDPDGKQLPYLDIMEARAAASWELIITKVIAGEVDVNWDSLIKDWSVITENQDNGAYHTMMWATVNTVDTGMLFHYCFDDPGLTDYPDGLLWQQTFRRALSVALDRERMNDIIYSGLGVPRQLAMPAVGAEYASERGQQILHDWETQDIEHDPEQAKQWLDDLGVVDVNDDGFRERPDGSPLEFILDVDVNNANYTKAAELAQEDYQQVGLKFTLNVIDGTILDERASNCESLFRARGGGASGLVAAPAHWAPIEDTAYCICGAPYGRWYQTKGAEGMEPPPGSFIEELQQAYAKAVVIADPDAQNDAILDAYQIHVDEGPIQIGYVQLPNQLVAVKDNLYNVPSQGIWATWTYGWPGAGDPEQWFKV